MILKKNYGPYALLLGLILFVGCQDDYQSSAVFDLKTAEKTGLHFSNDLEVSLDLNILNYLYYYNGGGLAAGDFNNDGWVDLYFTSNLGEDKMFLNQEELKFEDISVYTEVDAGRGGWTTGATVVDINSDGLLDIYICQVGKYRELFAKNKFLICTHIDENGIPHYEDRAAQYGLDFQGFSTHAAFVDYDLDGDLDMYLMNHSLHHNGTFGQRSDFIDSYHEFSGDRFYRNDRDAFTDVTKEVGIQSSVIGYGLGLAISDVNRDGYPDIYVANDFHENDYLYINRGNGTFSEELTSMMMHTSRFSMGCDIADMNNDGLADIMTLDMLPEDPEILKRSEGEDAINIFNFKLGYGYNHQYAMNCFQLNNGNGTFSDIGRYAGLHATDWSWSPLLADWNLDGLKDVFISNGIPKRMNDIDYINYISGNEVQYKIQFDQLTDEDLKIIDIIPEIKLKNKIFLNNDDLIFEDLVNQIDGNQVSYSNSAVFADFDNDGDYDIVTNNINEKAFLYENKQGQSQPSTRIVLNGPKENSNGIGTKILAYTKGNLQYFEHYSTKAFQSSMLSDIIVARPNQVLDSLIVIWPDSRYQKLNNIDSRELKVSYDLALPLWNYEDISDDQRVELVDRAADVGLEIEHVENDFIEFHREPLIPHSTSDLGPALAVGDLNGDGLDDLFLGSAKHKNPYLMFQQNDGTFERANDQYLEIDYSYEQVDAEIMDFDGDGDNDLLLANGGNEFYLPLEYNRPQLFINNGKGQLIEKMEAFDSVRLTASGLAVVDYDSDGDLDVFIGGRAVPYSYGEIPRSYLLENDGNGGFRDVTTQKLQGGAEIGLVKASTWLDIDADGDNDLIVAVEWDDVYLYEQQEGGQFDKKPLTGQKGWWTFVKPIDYNHDGKLDILVGNLGLNSRLKATKDRPVRLYYSDFDDNGSKEQLLTYYNGDREIPFHNMMELQKQMPYLKGRFQYAKDFATSSLAELIQSDKLEDATSFEANYFENCVLINNSEGGFSLEPLAADLQWTSYMDAYQGNVIEGSSEDDLFLVGNYFGNNVQMGRYDADFGTFLRRNINGEYVKEGLNGDLLKGQSRNIKSIQIADRDYLVVSSNDGSLKVLQISAIK